MRLFILRHGKAERDSISGRDEDRTLADRGHEQVRFLAESFLRASGEPFATRPERIFASGARRAVETARIVSEMLALPMESMKELGLGHRVSDLFDVLRVAARQNISSLLLVGHNPQLDLAVAHLFRLAQAQGRDPLPGYAGLRTGELVAFDIELGGAGRQFDDDDIQVHPVASARLAHDGPPGED